MNDAIFHYTVTHGLGQVCRYVRNANIMSSPFVYTWCSYIVWKRECWEEFNYPHLCLYRSLICYNCILQMLQIVKTSTVPPCLQMFCPLNKITNFLSTEQKWLMLLFWNINKTVVWESVQCSHLTLQLMKNLLSKAKPKLQISPYCLPRPSTFFFSATDLRKNGWLGDILFLIGYTSSKNTSMCIM